MVAFLLEFALLVGAISLILFPAIVSAQMLLNEIEILYLASIFMNVKGMTVLKYINNNSIC